jgi:Protein of unknown function (DUF2637)
MDGQGRTSNMNDNGIVVDSVGRDREDNQATAVAPAKRPPGREPWALRTGISLTVWTLAGVATTLAASGQIEFAHWAGINDIRAYAVPAVLELVAVAFLLIGYRRARRGDSASMLWLLAACVGGFAVYTNVVHTGGRAGLVFGAASAITLILWFVKLRDDYRDFQRETGQATRPRPKLGALWIVAPRLSLRASVIATRRRISTVDEAVGYAEVWRAVFEDARTARVGRRLARRTAWRSVAEVAGGPWAELPQSAEIAAVQVRQRAPLNGIPSSDRPAVAAAEPVPVALDGSLRSRVFAFLDAHVGTENSAGGAEMRSYLVWVTARGLGVTAADVADHVNQWCEQVAGNPPLDAYDVNDVYDDGRALDRWPTEQPQPTTSLRGQYNNGSH